MKTVLSIAGSDCSGGAGIQADIKTITAHKLYGMSVITALTAQNTRGVYGVEEASPEFVGQQMDCIFTDIFPDAVKIGMVSNRDIIEIIVKKLKEYGAKNIVLDPVMVATSGDRLLNEEVMDVLTGQLISLAQIITPNIPEAEELSNIKIENQDDMLTAAKKISENFEGLVLVKGGHLEDSADDLIYKDDEAIWARGTRINNPNTHGTGCTLSSAIASNLASGYSKEDSIIKAKAYVRGALKEGLDLGKGSGPLDHCYGIK